MSKQGMIGYVIYNADGDLNLIRNSTKKVGEKNIR
jgi:hypothetical protein